MARTGLHPPPWMLVRLALETGVHHAAADEARLRGLEIATIHQYRAFLARVFGFEAPVEQAIARVANLDPPLVRERARVGRLRRDLETLGLEDIEIERLPRCEHVELRTAAQALGWLYVIERHTLLAGLIRRQVLLALGARAEAVIGYLSAYGDTPGAHFRALGEALGAGARHHGATAIVAAANEAFRAQHHWYRSSRSPTDLRRVAA